MIIVTYCGDNYKESLDITLPTWKYPSFVYTDSDRFGIKMFEPSEDFDESCRRKILSIQRGIEENPGENIIYLDSDVYMVKPVDKVFEYPFDLAVTRMVRRDRFMPMINAGVSFWRANETTRQLCKDWLEREKQNRGQKYPEQLALNDIAYEAYDGKYPANVINISEQLYNFERDDTKQFVNGIAEYSPHLIHLKGKRWLDEFSLDIVKKYADSVHD